MPCLHLPSPFYGFPKPPLAAAGLDVVQALLHGDLGICSHRRGKLSMCSGVESDEGRRKAGAAACRPLGLCEASWGA